MRTDSAPTRSLHVRLLIILFLVNMVNFVDRQLPFILIEEIKRDLGMSDTQIGLVSGMSFTLVYSLMAIPVAVLADRWSAKWVLTGCVTIWCSLTALCGYAQNLVQFAVARMGVAAGEAGCTPSSHSLISALLPVERRAFGIAIFSLGVPIGGTLGLIAGGWLGDAVGWRMAMLIVGVPGLALAVVIALAVPNVRGSDHKLGSGHFVSGLRAVLAIPTIRHIVAGITVQGIGQQAIYAFSAGFLIRSHNLTTAEAGLGLGVANGLSGICALLVAGWFANRANVQSISRTLWLPALAFFISAPLIVAAYLTSNIAIALLLLAAFNFCAVFYMPSAFATVQRLAPENHRALSSSLIMLGVGLVGGSIGPATVGAVSDALSATAGADALRYALCLTAIPALWGGFHLVIAARRSDADLRRRESSMSPPLVLSNNVG